MVNPTIQMTYGDLCKKLQDEANKLCGPSAVTIAPVERPYGTMLYLSYGDKEYEFNPSGHNYLYVLHQLTDNPVMDAIME